MTFFPLPKLQNLDLSCKMATDFKMIPKIKIHLMWIFDIVLEEKSHLTAELQRSDLHILGHFGDRNPRLIAK